MIILRQKVRGIGIRSQIAIYIIVTFDSKSYWQQLVLYAYLRQSMSKK